LFRDLGRMPTLTSKNESVDEGRMTPSTGSLTLPSPSRTSVSHFIRKSRKRLVFHSTQSPKSVVVYHSYYSPVSV
jgi:hypothetical protein